MLWGSMLKILHSIKPVFKKSILPLVKFQFSQLFLIGFLSDNFIHILFAFLGAGKFVKKNALKILIVKAMRFALMGNVSQAVLVMITARKEKLVEMANA